MKDCLFCKIAEGIIPAQKVYEDEIMLGFKDIAPVCSTHILLIPKKHIASLFDAQKEDETLLGKMLLQAAALAQEKSAGGFRLVTNTGKIGGQEVLHLHFHILADENPLGRILSKE